MTHRDNKLDSLLEKRVKVWFEDGDILVGRLVYSSVDGRYGLQNCVDDKKGIMRYDTYFRKSHIRNIARAVI